MTFKGKHKHSLAIEQSPIHLRGNSKIFAQAVVSISNRNIFPFTELLSLDAFGW